MGIFGDDPDCMPTGGEVDSAVANGPGPNGDNYDPNYVPPFLSGTGCNACGYDDISDGESCPCCGIGHGITA